MRQTAVWIHDARGERPLSSEGYAQVSTQAGLFGTRPTFSRDGKTLFYLRRATPDAAIELWRTELASGSSEDVVPGVSILEFDVSPDGNEVVFSTEPEGKPTQIWIAALDRRSPPQMIASSGENSPRFGPDGQILYRLSDGRTHYLARMKRDGTGNSKVAPYPIGNVQVTSPDRRWLVSIMRAPDGSSDSMAVPVDGGPPRRICRGGCFVNWSPDARFLYLAVERPSRTSPGKTVAIPIPQGETFPRLPLSGISGADHAASFPGARVIDAWNISPGPDLSVFQDDRPSKPFPHSTAPIGGQP
jgi:dipeptidyl aminopeptidase/acylaminoacyl peptidase